MNNELINSLYNRIDALELIIRELQEDRIKHKEEIKHLNDLYNQALKDYDNEMEENCKLSKLWKDEREKNRKAIEYMKPRFMNNIGKDGFEDYDIDQIYKILKGEE